MAEGRVMTRQLPMVRVGDTLVGLQQLAAYWREEAGLHGCGHHWQRREDDHQGGGVQRPEQRFRCTKARET